MLSDAQWREEVAGVLARGHLDPAQIHGFIWTGQALLYQPGSRRPPAFASTGLSMVERFERRVSRDGPVPDGREFLGNCWIYRANTPDSDIIRESRWDGGTYGRFWRVTTIAKLLYDGAEDVPPREGEGIIEWLRRARSFYRDRFHGGTPGSGHRRRVPLVITRLCGTPLCVRGSHLIWEDWGQTNFEVAQARRLREGRAA